MFQVCMGALCFVYLICSLRTNIVFVAIFATLVVAFGLLTATYFQLANGNAVLAGRLQVAAGAFCFITCLCGWWIFAAIMLAALDFPFQIPGEFDPALSRLAASRALWLWLTGRPQSVTSRP